MSVPRWIDYLPDQTPLDETGIVPQIPFTSTAESFQGLHDDLLSAALTRMRAEPLPATPIVNPEASSTVSGPTVCDLMLGDGRIVHSATLDLTEVHLQTEYGQLIVPTNELIRLTFSSLPGEDIAATLLFTAVGDVEEQTFSGHTPGGPFSFQQSELKEIEFGLPATLADNLTNPPLQVLWITYSPWPIESIYGTGWGYSLSAQILQNLGAGNTEIDESVRLTPDLLGKYSGVVFLNRDSGGTLTAGEKEALREFLAAGNGVLVTGQQDGGYPLAPAAQFANSVSVPYGIELTTVTPNTRTPPASTKSVKARVGLRLLREMLRSVDPETSSRLTVLRTNIRKCETDPRSSEGARHWPPVFFARR